MEEVQRLLDQLVAAGAPGAPRGSTTSTAVSMRPGLHFRAGSLTKSLVATVVLQLVAEGRLSLSDALERWLPAILPYGDRVTIHQLLNHTSGVPHNWATVERTLYGSRQGRLRAWTPQALVGLVADQPPGFPPGTAWSYSNTGYVLLGLIVEAATGNTLARELGGCIFGPLGLRDTLLPGNSPGIPSPTSRGYSLPLSSQGEVITGPLLDFTAQNPSWAWAAGALVSTLEDLGHFFRALLGGRLLPPRLLAEMLSTVTVPPGSVPRRPGPRLRGVHAGVSRARRAASLLRTLARHRAVQQGSHAPRASSTRTGRAIPLNRSLPRSTKLTPVGETDSTTLSLTRTCPAPARAAIRAARFTVRPK